MLHALTFVLCTRKFTYLFTYLLVVDLLYASPQQVVNLQRNHNATSCTTSSCTTIGDRKLQALSYNNSTANRSEWRLR